MNPASDNKCVPFGKLSGFGLKFDWEFCTNTVLRERMIHSQIFDVDGYQCRAYLTINNATKDVSLRVKPIANSGPSESLKVALVARTYSREKDITVGNQMHQINLFAPSALLNFLTEDILRKYDSLSIEFILQREAEPDSQLKVFWNCPDTADIIILSEIPGDKPLFVHKKLVMEAIPNIQNIVTVFRNRYTGDKLPKRFVDLIDSTLEDMSLNSKVNSSRQSVSPTRNSSTNSAGKLQLHPTTTNASDGLSVSKKGVLSESSKELTIPDASTIGIETPTQNVSLYSVSHQKNPLLITDRYEIWMWPKKFPKNSCIDIMRWVYLKRLSPTFSIRDFDGFMELLVNLEQWEHYEEHALRARTNILSAKDVEVLNYLDESCFKNGYTKQLLRESLEQNLNRKLAEVLYGWLGDRVHQDKTGLIAETLKRIGI